MQKIEKGGKYYYRFNDFDIETGATSSSSVCGPNDPKIDVWQKINVILICDLFWRDFAKTLDFTIQDQANYPSDRRLDDVNGFPLGGIMLHLLMHVFNTAREVHIDREDLILDENGMSEQTVPDSVPATTYGRCAALARKDFYSNKVGKDRESISSVWNYIYYGLYAVLDDTLWWKRSGLPDFHGEVSVENKQGCPLTSGISYGTLPKGHGSR